MNITESIRALTKHHKNADKYKRIPMNELADELVRSYHRKMSFWQRIFFSQYRLREVLRSVVTDGMLVNVALSEQKHIVNSVDTADFRPADELARSIFAKVQLDASYTQKTITRVTPFINPILIPLLPIIFEFLLEFITRLIEEFRDSLIPGN